eukprot:1239161-Rhodomonas_salina.4
MDRSPLSQASQRSDDGGEWRAQGFRSSRRTGSGGEQQEGFALNMLEHLLQREVIYQKRERISAEKEQLAVELNDQTNKMLLDMIRSDAHALDGDGPP